MYNLDIINKIRMLPLKSSENIVALTIAFHVGHDVDFSYPSYNTIRKESGCTKNTISKALTVLEQIGVLERSSRGSILSGKKSNQYSFTFTGIPFVRGKLSNPKRLELIESLKQVRTDIDKGAVSKKTKTKPVSDEYGNCTTQLSSESLKSTKTYFTAGTPSQASTMGTVFDSMGTENDTRSNTTDVAPNNIRHIQPNGYDLEKSQKKSSKGKAINPSLQSNKEWIASFSYNDAKNGT